MIEMKKAVLTIVHDEASSKKDKNMAIATGAKLLQIEHKISPGEEGDFFK